LIKHIEAN